MISIKCCYDSGLNVCYGGCMIVESSCIKIYNVYFVLFEVFDMQIF